MNPVDEFLAIADTPTTPERPTLTIVPSQPETEGSTE